MKKEISQGLMLLFLYLSSCSKDIPTVTTQPPSASTDVPFTWGFPPSGYNDSLFTSNKTFKMTVLEYGTDNPIEGAKLKFGYRNNGIIYTDSLITNEKGNLLITGRNVSPDKCELTKEKYFTHGTLNLFRTANEGYAERLDTLYRMTDADSIVTRMYPLSWIKIHFSTDSVYAAGSFIRPYVHSYSHHQDNYYELANFSPNKDTVLKQLVFGNTDTQITVSVRNTNENQIKYIESQIKKVNKNDTATFQIKL